MSTLMYTAMSREISPQSNVELGSSDFNGETWMGVETALEVNILCLWAENTTEPLLIVSLDLLYPGRVVREVVELAAKNLDPSRILVVASHTHRAPMTDLSKPLLGKVNEHYLKFLLNELEQMVKECLRKEPLIATLHFGQVNASNSINRRRKIMFPLSLLPRLQKYQMAPNPEGSSDETLSAISLVGSDGNLVALVWSYACHPVGGPERHAASSGYPGIIREKIRIINSNNRIPVLFLQGFSGDTRPSETARVNTFAQWLRRFVFGPRFQDMGNSLYKAWTNSLFKHLEAAIRASKPTEVMEIITKRISVPAERIASGKFAEPVTFSKIDIGNVISVIGVSGEPVSAYSNKVRSLIPNKSVICVGCMDQVIGYLPTQEVQDQGGYEGGDFCHYFSLDALKPNIEKTVMNAFSELIKS